MNSLTNCSRRVRNALLGRFGTVRTDSESGKGQRAAFFVKWNVPFEAYPEANSILVRTGVAWSMNNRLVQQRRRALTSRRPPSPPICFQRQRELSDFTRISVYRRDLGRRPFRHGVGSQPSSSTALHSVVRSSLSRRQRKRKLHFPCSLLHVREELFG